MKKKIALCLAAIILSSTSVTLGYVIGSSNLGNGYPSFADSSNRPHKPNTNNRAAAEAYSREVEQYMRDVKGYVEAARNDIRRIQEAAEAARNEANSVVNEYNEYIRDRN